MGKTRTSPSGIEGFTLLEFLVVLALFVAVAFIVVPRLDNMVEGVAFRDSALRIQALLRLARFEAINKSHAVIVQPMANKNGLLIGDRKFNLPSSVVLVYLGVSGTRISGEENLIRLYPDGSADDGTLILQGQNRKLCIRIHPLVGKVDLVWQ